jgi:hypothetical protein
MPAKEVVSSQIAEGLKSHFWIYVYTRKYKSPTAVHQPLDDAP